MNYNLESVKYLFNRYTIKEIDGQYIALERKTNLPYYDENFVDKVKFAHMWVRATLFGRSRTTTSSNILTPEDYQYAFGDQAKDVYNTIMVLNKRIMQLTDKLCSKEDLRSDVEELLNYKYAGSIVEGLYEKGKYVEALENWVRNASGTPKKMQVNSGKHI